MVDKAPLATNLICNRADKRKDELIHGGYPEGNEKVNTYSSNVDSLDSHVYFIYSGVLVTKLLFLAVTLRNFLAHILVISL